MDASKRVGWSKLYPILAKMANNTCSGTNDWTVEVFLAAIQAVHFLLGKMHIKRGMLSSLPCSILLCYMFVKQPVSYKQS